MAHHKADEWIRRLQLQRHPEGGYFSEVYRSSFMLANPSLPVAMKGERALATSIYYLLKQGDFSSFHRIKSDETWHFYDGDDLAIYMIDEAGNLQQQLLSNQIGSALAPQFTVPAGCWFAAKSTGNFSLAGCTVYPGFDFEDFELADRQSLVKAYPLLKKSILRLTR